MTVKKTTLLSKEEYEKHNTKNTIVDATIESMIGVPIFVTLINADYKPSN